jgi:energy-coupling factor transporter ATP-binding protein EcfA2
MNNTDISFSNIYTGDRPSLLISSNTKSNYADGLACFVEMNKCFPSNIVFDNIKIPNFKEEVIKKYDVKPENIIEGLYPWHKDGEIKYIKNQITFMIDKDLVVQAYGGRDDSYDFRLYYCHTTNVEKKTDISDWFNSHYIENRNAEIGIIGNGPNGMFIRFFKVNIPNVSINEYYNDDFSDIHDKILEKLSNVNFNKGVILLHGKPGTGKTTYIRYLSSLIDKKMIFVPQELAYQIASPNFLSLLMDYPNSILILEDAENIIKDRIGNDNSPVASILNISDGLLSDCLNLQMICTFNTDLGRIDKALLRKGRIITKYKFDDLDFNKANKLSEKHELKRTYSKNIALAEIFNPEDDDYSTPKNTIGFFLKEAVPSEEPPKM